MSESLRLLRGGSWGIDPQDCRSAGRSWSTPDLRVDPLGFRVVCRPRQGSMSRMLRGGSWYINPRYCRSAYRYWDDPDNRYDLNGFRVACSPARK